MGSLTALLRQHGAPVPLQHAVTEIVGGDRPTPIQACSLPDALDGKDVILAAPTGSGKTVALTIPIALLMAEASSTVAAPRAVIIAPTREIAEQFGDIAAELCAAVGLRCVSMTGGRPVAADARLLVRPADAVVVTPGRLLDLVQRQKISLQRVQHLVLDEADVLTGPQFKGEMRRIFAALPADRQILAATATATDELTAVLGEYGSSPHKHEVADRGRATTTTAAALDSVVHVCAEPRQVLAAVTSVVSRISPSIVFVRRRGEVSPLVHKLREAGIAAVGLEGSLTPARRRSALESFSSEPNGCLVATDVAARGVDTLAVRVVVHVHPAGDTEAFIHRSGRTRRDAEQSGVVVTIVLPDEQERDRARMASWGIAVRSIDAEDTEAATALFGAPVTARGTLGRTSPVVRGRGRDKDGTERRARHTTPSRKHRPKPAARKRKRR